MVGVAERSLSLSLSVVFVDLHNFRSSLFKSERRLGPSAFARG